MIRETSQSAITAEERRRITRAQAGRNQRSPSEDLFCDRTLEWARQDLEGAPVRINRKRRESRRGREGVLLLSGFDANAFVHEISVQVSAAGIPYGQSVEGNRRGKNERELELIDTDVFDDDRYFDVVVEYAKGTPEDISLRITAHNRGPEAVELVILPTIWFRNTWSWDPKTERPVLSKEADAVGAAIRLEERTYGKRWLFCDGTPELLFTENESNNQKLFGVPNRSPYVKDRIDNYVVGGELEAVNPAQTGTKPSALYRTGVDARSSATLRLRRTDQGAFTSLANS